MIDGTLCAAFICTTISAGWAIKAKATCEQNYDFVWLYQTWFYNLITPIMLISQFVALIINWVNSDFLSTLAYLGIILGTGLINGYLIAPVLVKAFGIDRLGAILPVICCITSLVFLFVSL